MPTFEVMTTIGGLEYYWADYSVYVSVKRIKAHSDGKVTGEITILNAEKQILYPATIFNFNADRTRNSLAKTLTEKDKERPWQDIINSLSVSVLEITRQGEPVQELWTSDDVPPMEFLLDPLIIKGLPTIVFGEKGAFKSGMGLMAYLCLILPWHDNPLGFIAPKKSIKPLILDYELPGDIAQRNLKQFVDGMELGPIPLYHRHCSAPLAEEVEQIANQIKEVGAECLIIDSLARASGGELNKTEPANAFFEALDKFNLSSLILAQTSKDKEGKGKSIYGNALFTYYARSVFELCKQESLRDNILDVALFHRHANLTKINKDMGFRITFNGTQNTITRESVDLGEFMEKVSTQKAIFNELKTGAMSPADLADATGSKVDTVKVVLNRLKKRGLVVNLEHGIWGLPARK